MYKTLFTTLSNGRCFQRFRSKYTFKEPLNQNTQHSTKTQQNSLDQGTSTKLTNLNHIHETKLHS